MDSNSIIEVIVTKYLSTHNEIFVILMNFGQGFKPVVGSQNFRTLNKYSV